MMKLFIKNSKGITLLFFVLVHFIAKSQQSQYNLVPNYSFEDSALCPYTTGAPPPKPWYITSNIPYAIYCNTCSVSLLSSVPYNTWGYTSYQYPYDGNAYIGGDLLNHPATNGNGRTYAEVKLKDSLENGQCYYVEFYTSLVNTSQYACNNISVSLSITQLWQNSNPSGLIPFNAQIYNYGNPIITDTMNWVKVSAVYTAQGGEKYLTVGNFKNDNQTNYIRIDSIVYVGNPRASYYFDAIQIIPLGMEPAYANAFAGDDVSIAQGDSAFIGSLTNGITNIAWYNNTGQKIDSIRPGFYVKPTSSTYYVVAQTVCGNYSTDTVWVYVNPLPLKFISYALRQAQGDKVENIWQTANEINVSHFNIQRSLNGRDFINIGKTLANNKSYNEYKFTDDGQQSTVNGGLSTIYYRIESIDKDGKKQYSETRTINLQPQTFNSVSIYPNPAKDVVTINCIGAREILILDCFGRVVQKFSNPSSSLLWRVGEAKGLYVVKAIMNNGDIKTEKLTVQ